MKLHLPKILLTALLSLSVFSPAYSSDIVISGPGSYSASKLILNSDIKITVEGNFNSSNENLIQWTTPIESGTLEGTGSISSQDNRKWILDLFASETSTTYTIGDGITLKNAEIYCSSAPGFEYSIEVNIQGVLDNCDVDALVGTVDLTKATLRGNMGYDICNGGKIIKDTLEINNGDNILTYLIDYRNDNIKKSAVLEGNLILDGKMPAIAGEQRYDYYPDGFINPAIRTGGVVVFWVCQDDESEPEPFVPLSVTGTITIKSSTGVIFANEGDWDYNDSMSTWVSDYRLPTPTDVLFICSSVDEKSLSLLKPYVYREDSWSSYETTGGYEYVKPVDDHVFFAQTGADGRVYIFLGKGNPNSNTPVAPNTTVVQPGENVQLGVDAGLIPSVDKPVYLMGGATADATLLDSSLLNNQVISGIGGTVVTGAQQQMSLTGSGTVNYSVVGVNSAAGAMLNIAASGNLTLSGEKYDTAAVAVKSGTVTISQGTTLGMGSGSTRTTVDKGANMTNFGMLASDVKQAGGSTLLNQGTVLGDIEALADSVVTNNGSIEGTLESAGKVFGSGTFAETNLLAGAYLHVGNSPGYQQHGTLTLERGTTLSFSVDGNVAATATSNGSGTYSVLKADTLTINPGSEAVNVTVEVTQGILAAGTDALTLTLMEVQNTNATEDDFSFTLEDNGWLEEGATLSWDSASGSLTLAGEVSKAALAAMLSNAGTNVANTMWASANAVQEMVRTAENQFLVGMPGQTTFWGAGIGSFMNVSGSAGFTSNAGGYAVGLQHAFTDKFRAGIAFGQTFGTFESEDKQLKADQMSLIPALTAQYVTALDKVSSLTVSGHLSYGVVKNEADSSMMESTSKTEWDDTVLNIGVRAAWNRQLTANTTASVFAGLTYQQVEQDSFKEKQDGFVREYRDGSMSSLSLPIGVTLRGIYQMEGTNVFVPEVTVAYIGDIARENPEVKSTVMGVERKATGSKVGRSAITVSAGANWMFDSTWSVGAFYTMEARSKQFNQSVNAALRCSF